MKRHVEQRAESLFTMAVSEREMSSGMITLFELIAVVDSEKTFLSVLHQDELARLLVKNGRGNTVVKFMAETPTARELAKHVNENEEKEKAAVQKKMSWWQNVFTPLSGVIWRSSPP